MGDDPADLTTLQPVCQASHVEQAETSRGGFTIRGPCRSLRMKYPEFNIKPALVPRIVAYIVTISPYHQFTHCHHEALCRDPHIRSCGHRNCLR